MARAARQLSIDPSTIQVVHIWNRCVRRAFLCGLDPVTGVDFEHRRQWARERLEHLASVFAIDCITFAIMSNHHHQVLRSRPDIVKQWDDETVARRWLRLTPKRTNADGSPGEPTENEINAIINNPERLAEYRVRLSDISWWMRYFAQDISCRCNREDEITGHFWESRFGSDVILDSASVLACMVYVDLNPVRAQMAATPEESDYTGAKERIDDLRVHVATEQSNCLSLTVHGAELSFHDWERSDNQHSGWLCPIEIDEANDPIGADAESSGRRASRKGVAPISVAQYLELLDWTGRTLRSDKRGVIPTGLASVLERIGAGQKGFLRSVLSFGNCLKNNVIHGDKPTLANAVC